MIYIRNILFLLYFLFNIMDIRDITFKKNREPYQGPAQTIPLFINSLFVGP